MIKSLGQNFLVDENVINKIIDNCELTKNDLVIEVGPGAGSLTKKIVDKAGFVFAIEIDKYLIPLLNELLIDKKNIKLLNEDILKIDIKKLVEESDFFKENTNIKIKVISNLPYYITTPVMMKFLEGDLKVDLMVFMVQKEVAQRIVAVPSTKDYGALSVGVQFYSMPEKLFNVSKSNFIPSPDVESSIIRLKSFEKSPYEIICKKTLFKFVKASFGQRRKTLVNALYNSGMFNIKKEEFVDILKELDFSENVRGEELDIKQFCKLTNLYIERMRLING